MVERDFHSASLPEGITQIRLPLKDNPLRHINSYLLKADDGYVLVDCGWDTPDVLDALEATLREQGIGLDDIRSLVVTHLHSDHYGLAGTLTRLTKLRLLMHRLDWVFLRTRLSDPGIYLRQTNEWLARNGFPYDSHEEVERSLGALARFTLVQPDEQLEDSQTIGVGRHSYRVVWTPGHTPGHVCLYDEENRVLLSGDHVLDPITPNVSAWLDDPPNPLGDFLESLKKVSELEAETVLPAHGEPFTGLQRRVGELLAHHDEREGLVLAQLDDGPVSAAQVARGLPWTRRRQRLDDLPSLQQRMAVSETLSHLEHLRATGRACRLETDGAFRFQKVEA